MDPANQTAHNMWMALKNTFEPVEIDDYIDLSKQVQEDGDRRREPEEMDL
jgi:hypothetical protein